MNVYRIAKQPELGDNTEEFSESLGFNVVDHSLSIPYRSGQSSNGQRNKEESLMIALSNIPDGYTIAQNVDGKYISVGATDEFGTTVLFSIPKSNKTSEQLAKYQLLNNGNLYLVSNTGDVGELSDKVINIAVTASIKNENNLDTRSITTFSKINLKDIEKDTIKYLDNIDMFVDPLVIDLSGGGSLPLTDLEENHNSVRFEMIPGKDKIYTGWIDSSEQLAGLIISNDTSNDNDEIVVNSSREILSEYFRSSNDKRSYSSGSNALLTFDSNQDGLINQYDKNWEDLQVWIDDGDGISTTEEIYELGEFVNEIDVANIETIPENPEWSNGNNVLSEVIGTKGGKQFKIYDIGFKVAFKEDPQIDLDVSKYIEYRKVGNLAYYASSPGIVITGMKLEKMN